MSNSALVLKQTVFEDEARKIAEKKGDWLWNIVFSSQKLTELRLMYIEYIIINIETTSSQTLFSKFKSKTFNPIVKRLQIIVNGTTGSVALVTDRDLAVSEMMLDDDIEIQCASFDEEEVIRRAKMLAHKITHRSMGGMHEAEVKECISIFRPFWVAFYGDVKEGNKVRYITIPADGGHNCRAR